MINYKHLILCAVTALPITAIAQTKAIDFETADAYTSLGVYDTWPDSPFRTNKLEGNVKVVTNHLNTLDDGSGVPVNPSAHILGVQRSRYGSNTFGARIDLKEPFQISPTKQYVHVLINKPTSGRVMLIGLGKRQERYGQSKETEQFWVLSSTKMVADKWNDAVFAINGQSGIDIYSLVVVPDCESTHELTEDFLAYIDEIVINDSKTPRVINGDYPLNFEEDMTSQKAGNYVRSLSLSGSADGNQTIEVGSKSPQVVYRSMLDKSFTAKAGETLTPAINYSTGWMNGYVYLDRGSDGKFTYDLNDNYTIPEGSDIMSYSYIETVDNTSGYKSDGSAVSGDNRNFMNPPAFKVPEDLTPGYYRMRFKVDWGNVDPGGNVMPSNSIDKNGGMIVDVRMNIHKDEVTISRSGGLNGDICTEDGELLRTVTVPFGKPFTVMAKPENGFKLSYLRVRHGYNLTGDSLVHGTPQYIDEIYPAYLFKDNKFTIPAEVIDADVYLIPEFAEASGNPSTGVDYARNFSDDLTNASPYGRKLNSFKLVATKGGTTDITVPSGTDYVYRSLLNKEASVVPGDEVTLTTDYTGSSMHSYLYVDLNQDGQFDAELAASGKPTINSELVSYSYYKGFNSLGESISRLEDHSLVGSVPVFTIPSSLPTGVYRARLKVDWDNIDPAGQWSDAAGATNQIDQNGGYVVDFLLNVHPETSRLDLLTTDGSIVGANNAGTPVKATYRQALDLMPLPASTGYVASEIKIRHGHDLDGKQYVHGNRQWSEYTVPADKAFTIPADSVNGDVRITADFVAQGDPEWKLVFSDEFNGEDGSKPDETKWNRSGISYSATWKRFVAQTDEGKRQTSYVEDGKLVSLCKPNTLPDEVDRNGNMQQMISGSVESRGKFDFLYGKVECRLMTEPYRGNFPALWMMPADQTEGWPYCGEIDIWEQIDAQNISHHTIHSKWANGKSDGELCQNQGNNPPKTGTVTTTNGEYHVFGFEWNTYKLTWYVDGKKVFSYAKAADSNALKLGQWPFDKAFYLILNQSVGNGGWAAAADVNHTYKTLFDWVRVYQKGKLDSVDERLASDSAFDYYVRPGKVLLVAPIEQAVNIHDLQGKVLYSQKVQGNVSVTLPQGVCIINGEKVIIP